MKRLPIFFLTIFALLASSVLLSACSKDNFRRAGYESVKNYQCNEQMNDLGCRDNYPSYEDYQREKFEIPKQSETSK